jgi:hypothetical protein
MISAGTKQEQASLYDRIIALGDKVGNTPFIISAKN